MTIRLRSPHERPLWSILFTIGLVIGFFAGVPVLDAKPLKVYLLVGQSNMQGHARTTTMEHIGMDPETAPLLAEMQDENGDPVVCDDVWISYLSNNGVKEGKLTAGFGADDSKIGPEFTFGLTVSKQLREPILIIKTAWGGKSLNTDFRSPSSGPYEFSESQLQRFAQQEKNIEQIKAEKAEATGHYYRLMLEHAKKVLSDIRSVYPDYNEADGYELAGFVWFQGWNDMVDSGTYPARDQPGGYDAYSVAMANFIRDVRKDLETPEMPFVIGVLGVGGPVADYGPEKQRYAGTHQYYRNAMAAPAKLPEFAGNVFAVLTENYWDPELTALTDRDGKVKQAAKAIHTEKGLKGAEAQAVLDELRAEEFSEEELKIMSVGISNQAYHYLGSGKILGQIGQGFAEALMRKKQTARPSGLAETLTAALAMANNSRAWTQASTGKQLQGELIKVSGGGVDTRITIRSGERLIEIPLAMLAEDDQAFVKSWQGPTEPGTPQAAASAASIGDLVLETVPDGIPDFTKGTLPPREANHDWNLGPTGARGWIYSNKLETSEARQIFVTKVEAGSPAEGKLEVGDVIVGTGSQPFSDDPRTELGKAIVRAEASDGYLNLLRWKEEGIDTVTVSLKVLGSYSPTAPFDCPKSRMIFEQGCEALAERIEQNPTQGNPITRSMNGLALLASGKEEYLPIVREQVEGLKGYSDPERRTLHSWYYGPVTILLAEYTLATGDKKYLPELGRLTTEIVEGQSVVGSWGHRFIQGNGILSGYGMMNAPGVPLTTSLILARAAGVQSAEIDEAIEKSTRLLRFYVGKGSIPYGDHRPWTQTHEDNGKNGMAAVMFNLLDDASAAEYFSRMGTASHGAEREMGHTGNFFNMLWAMPSVALSGPQATGAWMEEFGWYYDLARGWDGTYQHQGPPEERKDKYAGWDSSGAYLLAYAQPLRQIYLTGKKQGLVPQINEATAAGLINDGRDWSPRFKNEVYADRDEDALLEALKSWSPVVRERAAMALGKLEESPTKQLVELLESGDLYAKIGACQAIAFLKGKASDAVPALTNVLQSDDLWLRIEAAEALAAIGPGAESVIPELLTMMASNDPESDPRNMQQRYLCFALFDRRSGMLRGSLDGVERDALFEAVKSGLQNEDGRARGTFATVYKQLSYDEIKPILPVIYEAIVTPAPSGIMFADGIRLSGLELLAANHVEESMPLCFELMGIERWGKKDRINRCLKALTLYGGAAKPMIPVLLDLEKQLESHSEAKSLESIIAQVGEVIAEIEADENPPELRSIKE